MNISDTEDILKVFIAVALTFFIGIGITPTISYYLYHYKAWKKKARTVTTDGREAVIFNKIHNLKETSTPRMGGLVIWVSVLLTTALLALLPKFTSISVFQKLNFFSRNQTWLPLFTLVSASLV